MISRGRPGRSRSDDDDVGLGAVVLGCGVLCYWAYCDLPTAYLLAPTGMASGLVRLYNFMHFGHSAAMSMEAAIVMLLPLALWGLVTAVARSRLWVRW